MNLSSHYNFERKYQLKNHIVSNLARKYKSGELKLLFAETNSKCGDCGKPFDWNFSGDIDSKANQIAHIYGKKLFGKSQMPLDEKYHINHENDINRYHNLIILCDSCHKEYDDKPTYEKYVEILNYKKRVSSRVTDKTYIYFALEDILQRIKDGAFQTLGSTDSNNLSSNEKTKLKYKLDYNKINSLKKRRVVENVTAYFKEIKDIFDDINDDEKYLKHYNKVYLELKKNYSDKNEILNIIDSALIETDNNIFNDVIPIITSYMIMICEVLDNVTE